MKMNEVLILLMKQTRKKWIRCCRICKTVLCDDDERARQSRADDFDIHLEQSTR